MKGRLGWGEGGEERWQQDRSEESGKCGLSWHEAAGQTRSRRRKQVSKQASKKKGRGNKEREAQEHRRKPDAGQGWKSDLGCWFHCGEGEGEVGRERGRRK